MIIVLSVIFGSKLFAFEVLNLEANYKIPTISAEEESYSVFRLENYQVKIYSQAENQPDELSYTLPEDMAGQKTTIELQLIESSDGVKYLAGEKATAKCFGAWKEMKCEMRFYTSPVDLTLVEANLKQSGASHIEIKNRLQILSRFSGDPIGFTEISH